MFEPVGIAATVLILIAFLQKNERQIRIYDAIGAALFVLYGVLIRSFSTVVLNAALIAIQLWKLRGLCTKEGG